MIVNPAQFGFFFFFQAEDGIRDSSVTGVQTCALPIWPRCISSSRLLRSPARGRYRVDTRIGIADRDSTNRRPFARDPEPRAEIGHAPRLDAGPSPPVP